VPVPDNRRRPAHQRGVTGWPGLCLPGLTWQHTRGLGGPNWVNDDAGYIAHQLDVGG
jgi:putative flavoprotein involved in K+ transport